MNLHRLLTSTCLIVLISGCASLDVLMVTASGISYLVSGKSITDNIVSTVIDEDCAAHRLLLNKDICVPTNKPADMLNDPEVMIASNSSNSSNSLPGVKAKTVPEQKAGQPEVYQQDNHVVIAQALDRSEQFEELLPKESSGLVQPPKSHPAASQLARSRNTIAANDIAKNMTPPQTPAERNHYIENPQTFIVIGSFNELAFARERQISHLAFNAEVVSNLHNDKTKFRVVVGPYNELDSEESLSRLPELEKFSPWRINLCASSMAPPPCESSVVARVDF